MSLKTEHKVRKMKSLRSDSTRSRRARTTTTTRRRERVALAAMRAA